MNVLGMVEGTPQVPAEGRLEGVSLPELLWDLCCVRHTGALLIERQGTRKVLYFRDGRIVFAASTDPEDRLGAFLFRRGEVALAPLLEAGGEVARGRRLGQILVAKGLMDADQLVRAVLDHVREIILSIFPWSAGRWRLSRASLPADESITLDVPTEELLLSGVRRVRDGGRVRRAVGGPRAVYRAVFGAPIEVAGLGTTERSILDELRRPLRVDRLCREVFAPSEVVFRSLWALAILGLVERIEPEGTFERRVGEEEATEGFLEARGGAPELLLELGDRRFTGAVRLHRRGVEGVLFLKEGLVDFARISDSELSLAAHLLRRGVISDQDRDEAARRLVSGKRIGALLAEQGALDYQDLKRFVREQVLEVVKKLALWSEGEYELTEGETVDESITLGRSAEDVVMGAYESLDACERIWRELGPLETVYRLRGEYLQRLDRMTLRPGVWEIVSMLSEEKTVGELLEARPEPDFDVCRWLCGLVRVRVVERVSARADGLAAPWSNAEAEMAAPEAAAPEAPPVGATAAEIAPELFKTGGIAVGAGLAAAGGAALAAGASPALTTQPQPIAPEPAAPSPATAEPEHAAPPETAFEAPAAAFETPLEVSPEAPESGFEAPSASAFEAPLEPSLEAPAAAFETPLEAAFEAPGAEAEVPSASAPETPAETPVAEGERFEAPVGGETERQYTTAELEALLKLEGEEAGASTAAAPEAAPAEAAAAPSFELDESGALEAPATPAFAPAAVPVPPGEEAPLPPPLREEPLPPEAGFERPPALREEDFYERDLSPEFEVPPPVAAPEGEEEAVAPAPPSFALEGETPELPIAPEEMAPAAPAPWTGRSFDEDAAREGASLGPASFGAAEEGVPAWTPTPPAREPVETAAPFGEPSFAAEEGAPAWTPASPEREVVETAAPFGEPTLGGEEPGAAPAGRLSASDIWAAAPVDTSGFEPSGAPVDLAGRPFEPGRTEEPPAGGFEAEATGPVWPSEAAGAGEAPEIRGWEPSAASIPEAAAEGPAWAAPETPFVPPWAEETATPVAEPSAASIPEPHGEAPVWAPSGGLVPPSPEIPAWEPSPSSIPEVHAEAAEWVRPETPAFEPPAEEGAAPRWEPSPASIPEAGSEAPTWAAPGEPVVAPEAETPTWEPSPESIPETRGETPRRVPLGGPMVERAPEVSTWEPSPASIPAPEAALEAAPEEEQGGPLWIGPAEVVAPDAEAAAAPEEGVPGPLEAAEAPEPAEPAPAVDEAAPRFSAPPMPFRSTYELIGAEDEEIDTQNEEAFPGLPAPSPAWSEEPPLREEAEAPSAAGEPPASPEEAASLESPASLEQAASPEEAASLEQAASLESAASIEQAASLEQAASIEQAASLEPSGSIARTLSFAEELDRAHEAEAAPLPDGLESGPIPEIEIIPVEDTATFAGPRATPPAEAPVEEQAPVVERREAAVETPGREPAEAAAEAAPEEEPPTPAAPRSFDSAFGEPTAPRSFVSPFDSPFGEPTAPRAPAEPSAEAQPAEAPDEPSAETRKLVDRFNRRHQIVFDGLRREIGAGVGNFIKSCEKRLGPGGEVFADLAPNSSGAFDADALARAIAAAHLADEAAPLEALIGEELGLVRDLVDRARLQAIERQLAEL